MLENFSDRSRMLVDQANTEALRFQHPYIRPVHLLIAMAETGVGVGITVLRSLGVDLCVLRLRIEKLLVRNSGERRGKLPFESSLIETFNAAGKAARNLGHNYVGSEHLLIGLLHDNEVSELWSKAGVQKISENAVRDEIRELVGIGPIQMPYEETVPVPNLTMETDRCIDLVRKMAEKIEKRIDEDRSSGNYESYSQLSSYLEILKKAPSAILCASRLK